VAAFFDLDRTLIRGSATFPLAVAAFRAGLVPVGDLVRDLAQALWFILRGSTDRGSEALRERVLRAVAGQPRQRLVELGESFIPRLAATVRPAARRLLDQHQAQGHHRVIVTASPIEIAAGLATALGLEGAAGTRAEVDAEGRYTGRLAGAFCYRDGKVTEVQRLSRLHDYDLERSYAYSDSISDLPFLQCVGHPVAVNPDRGLRAHATRRNWPIIAAG
jgi:HAD superfamily hydrolase (TIGR01490 family)